MLYSPRFVHAGDEQSEYERVVTVPPRHLHRPEYTVDRVAAQPQEVGEVLLHILRVCLARDAQRVVAGGVKLRAEVEQILYGFAAAWHKTLHLIDELLYRAWEGRVDMHPAVGGGGDNAEVIRNHVPRNVKAELITDPAAAAGVFLCAPFADLVQRRFKFKTASTEA